MSSEWEKQIKASKQTSSLKVNSFLYNLLELRMLIATEKTKTFSALE